MASNISDTASGIIRTISHDFKEPLRSVRWYLKKLKEGSDLGRNWFAAVDDLDDVVRLTQADFHQIYDDYREKRINLPNFRTFIRTRLEDNMRFIDANWQRLYPHIRTTSFTDPNIIKHPDISVSALNETIKRILRRYEGLRRYLDVRNEPIRVNLGLHNEVTKVIGDLTALMSTGSVEYSVHGALTSKFDQTLMSLIFQNLIVNSIKYRETGRALRIVVRMARVFLRDIIDLLTLQSDFPRLRDHGTVVGIVVYADNGRGIPPTHAESAFRPFIQVNPTDASEGSGMGLAIVRSAVEQHDGMVWLKSRVGIGTTFFLLFPIEEAAESRVSGSEGVRAWFEQQGGID
jgi:signal transduction histidine kinase